MHDKPVRAKRLVMPRETLNSPLPDRPEEAKALALCTVQLPLHP